MKKILKGLMICSLSIVMGKEILFNNSVSEYKIKNDIKMEKDGYPVDLLPDACVTEETIVDNVNNIKLGDLVPVLVYKNGDVVVEQCDNMNNPILTTIDNCELEGWYYDEELTQKASGTVIGDIMQTNPVNKDVTAGNCITKYEYITYVYAKCKTPSVPVTPTCPTDMTNMYTVNYVVDDTVIAKKEAKVGENLTTINPTKEGYKFDGWYTDAELKNKFDGNVTLSKKFDENNCLIDYEDVVLYGQWVKNEIACDVVEEKFTISFNTNGGNKIDSIDIKKGIDTTKKIEKPVRDGYEFNGWYLDEKLTQKVTFKTLGDIKPEKYVDSNGCIVGYKNISLYASWTKNEHNPNTSDNIIIYISLGLLLIMGSIVITKKLTNK